jgi:hypothetical protein
VEHYPRKAPQRPAAHVVIRRVRSSLRAWASPACDHETRWRSWRRTHHGAAWALNTPHRGQIGTSGRAAGPRRQQPTAATTSPSTARDHPVSTLRPAQMTVIDLLATRSHRGDRQSAVCCADARAAVSRSIPGAARTARPTSIPGSGPTRPISTLLRMMPWRPDAAPAAPGRPAGGWPGGAQPPSRCAGHRGRCRRAAAIRGQRAVRP